MFSLVWRLNVLFIQEPADGLYMIIISNSNSLILYMCILPVKTLQR